MTICAWVECGMEGKCYTCTSYTCVHLGEPYSNKVTGLSRVGMAALWPHIQKQQSGCSQSMSKFALRHSYDKPKEPLLSTYRLSTPCQYLATLNKTNEQTYTVRYDFSLID